MKNLIFFIAIVALMSLTPARCVRAQVAATGIATSAWVTIDTSGEVACVSDTTSRQLSATVTNAGANPMNCGDVLVGAARGDYIVAAGGSATYPTSAAIWCYSALGTTATCRKILR